MKYLSITILALFIISNNYSFSQSQQQSKVAEGSFIKDVDAATFKELVEKGNGIILDVRTPEEVAAGHIENASTINFYDPDFSKKIDLMQKDKNIYVYCKSGGRSGEAAKILNSKGFTKVYNLKGGIMAWENSKFPITKSTASEDNKIQSITLNDFKKMLESTKPVLVDFHTVWCAPCRKMAPIVDEIEKEFADKALVKRIDMDKSKEVGKEYEITGVPVFIIFKNGEAKWKHNGLISKDELVKQLKKYF